MCGIAGYINIPSLETRQALVRAFGPEIDSRGGHSCGFVSTSETVTHYGRTAGTWAKSRQRFKTAAGQLNGPLIMHSRLATCGIRDLATQAHPYAIERDGKTVLWGAHNGCIWDAEDSAEEHNRPYDVDSRELFQLIADEEYDYIRKMTGYGTLAFIDAHERQTIKLVKMTESADLEICNLEDGGTVFASTWGIIFRATKEAGLKVKNSYTIKKGDVFLLRPDGVFVSDTVKIYLDGSYTKWSGKWKGGRNYYDYGDYSEGWDGSYYSTNTAESSYEKANQNYTDYLRKWNNRDHDSSKPKLRVSNDATSIVVHKDADPTEITSPNSLLYPRDISLDDLDFRCPKCCSSNTSFEYAAPFCRDCNWTWDAAEEVAKRRQQRLNKAEQEEWEDWKAQQLARHDAYEALKKKYR